MSKKNIWIINETIGSRHHGMVFRPYYIAKEMVKKGHNVTVFSGSYSHIYSKLPDMSEGEKIEEIDGVKYCWIKTPKYSRSQSIGRIINAFIFVFKLFFLKKKSFPKPDIVIVTSPTPFSILNGYFFKKRYKAKLIFEVRDIWPLTLIEIGNISKWHPFVLFMQVFENFSYRVSDKVISVLPFSKEHMIKHGMREEKFLHIPNGIDLDEMNCSAEVDPEKIKKIPQDKFIVIYTGKMGQSNALNYLIEAAERLQGNSDIQFVLVGSGVEKEGIVKRAEDCKLNITFIDSVKKEQVQSILKYADVCYIGWHKNDLYNYGISANKIFDYMYAAKPVLHSVQSTANDCIKEVGCGVSVDAEDSEKIAMGILELFSMSNSERVEMGKLGREYVVKNHSYEKLVEYFLSGISD